MAYTIPDFSAIRARYLRDVLNLRPSAHVDADSDHYVRGSAVSSAVEGLYDYQAWIARQILPDTSDPEYLELHAALRGMQLKAATPSDGLATIAGTPGAQVPPGAQIKLKGGSDAFVLTAGGVVPAGGQLVLPCRAMQAGAYPDLVAAPALLQSAPSGVQGECLLTISGGSDVETPADLLDRLLYYMRNPPGGGNRYDYVRWALEVPGVTAAWCYPHRRGVGRVDLIIVSADGLPAAELVAAVQAHVDELRPVACRDVLVLGPLRLDVSPRLALRLAQSYTLADLRAQIEDVLGQYFVGIVPGGEVILSRLESLVLGLPGVIDARIIDPAGNIQAGPMEWPRLGELALEAL